MFEVVGVAQIVNDPGFFVLLHDPDTLANVETKSFSLPDGQRRSLVKVLWRGVEELSNTRCKVIRYRAVDQAARIANKRYG